MIILLAGGRTAHDSARGGVHGGAWGARASGLGVAGRPGQRRCRGTTRRHGIQAVKTAAQRRALRRQPGADCRIPACQRFTGVTAAHCRHGRPLVRRSPTRLIADLDAIDAEQPGQHRQGAA